MQKICNIKGNISLRYMLEDMELSENARFPKFYLEKITKTL